MKAMLYEIFLHMKLNVRSKELLVHYYIVPFIFYVLMSSVFTSIMPDAHLTLIQSMTVFSVTMGGVMGSPYPLIEFYGSEIKKAYHVGNIPLWTLAAGNFLSSLVHIFAMSLVIFFTAPIFFDAVVPKNLAEYFLMLLLVIVVSLCVGLVFGLYTKSSSKVGMATQLVFMPSMIMSGIMFPVTLLPDSLQTIGKVLPATWGFEAMCTENLQFGSYYPLLIIMAITLVLSLWKLRKISID
ncbi:ABC transporter permease [Emergencia sp.]|uniref:ABC transporter permease n=1 Tax=Emergencia sp. TaxID=1926557 RepID=UPI003AEFC6BC